MKGNNNYSSLEGYALKSSLNDYALKSSLNDYANKNEILTNGNGLITTVSNPDNHDVGFHRMGQGQNSFFMMSNNGYMYRCESDGTGHVIFDDGILPWGNEQVVPL